MLPKVIVYNSVSIDGSIKDFDVNIGLHYEVAANIGADALLVGSITARTGVEMFVEKVPPEESRDFCKRKVEGNMPLWVIPDSKGILKGLLHVHRRSNYCKDIIILVSKKTSMDYLNYLKERNYDYILTGEDHTDLREALSELNKRYGIETVATDSGGVLAGVLLDAGLVEEVQLLISPEIVGKNAVNLFRTVQEPIRLELTKNQTIDSSHILLAYKVHCFKEA